MALRRWLGCVKNWNSYRLLIFTERIQPLPISDRWGGTIFQATQRLNADFQSIEAMREYQRFAIWSRRRVHGFRSAYHVTAPRMDAAVLHSPVLFEERTKCPLTQTMHLP